jgi:tRNA dimethylallyltransferase
VIDQTLPSLSGLAVFVLGPTASGKTAVALALAQRFPVEVVSVDSAQVYRGMDVGTAKPDAGIRARVPHHLIDVTDPTDPYSAGRFRDDALRLSGEILARRAIPVFAGGTMLYYRTLTRGMADLPPASAEIRAQLDRDAAIHGWPALHARLAAVDPASAARLDPNDAQRIQRALEVFMASGTALSEHHAREAPRALPFAALRISLEPSDRSALHLRIARRFEQMLGAGLVAEVRSLRERFVLHGNLPAMRAVGYRQVWETLEGSAPEATLAARGIAATRQLAKRQLTWLRAMNDVERFDCLRPDLAAAVIDRVARERALERPAP